MSSGSETRPIRDLHIEITEDSSGIVKIRPSSASSSYCDDGRDLSISREDLNSLEGRMNTPNDDVSMDNSQIHEEDVTREETETAEESYRIFIDRDHSKSDVIDDVDKHSGFHYRTSEDGYEISFIDENKESVRTLSLSSDFKHSYENKCESQLSVDNSVFDDSTSDYGLDYNSLSREDICGEMEKTSEYSIEVVDEGGKRELQKKKRRKQKMTGKKGKRKLITTSITDGGFVDEMSKSWEKTSLKRAKSVEILFINEDEPDRKSSITLSGDFSRSCNEELILHYKPISIENGNEPEVKTEDYDILDNVANRYGDSQYSSTPKRSTDEFYKPESDYGWEKRSSSKPYKILRRDEAGERASLGHTVNNPWTNRPEKTSIQLKYNTVQRETPHKYPNIETTTSLPSDIQNTVTSLTKSITPATNNNNQSPKGNENKGINNINIEQRIDHMNVLLSLKIEPIPKRTVFREMVSNKTNPNTTDSDDELIEVRGEEREPRFTVERLQDEKVGVGLARTISGKLKGSFKRFFKSPEGDKFGLSEERGDEEDKLHSIQPLSLVPVDVADEDNDIEDESDLMTVNVKIGTLPSSDKIVDEPVDAIEVESIEHTFEIDDDDDDELGDSMKDDEEREEDVKDVEEPDESPEEDKLKLDRVEISPDGARDTLTMHIEVVPRRTVFREKIPDVKEEDAADSDDELKEIRDDKDEPKFIVESIDEEKVGKGLVKSITGKVKGSLKRIFKSTESDEFGLSEDRSDEEDKLHSIQPLSLVPVDVADEDNDIEDESDLMTVNVEIGTLPSSDEIVDEPVDAIEVESIEHTFEIADDDDELGDSMKDDEDGEEDVKDVEEPDESPEEDKLKLDRVEISPDRAKDTLTMHIEVVPRRTVFREKVPDVKEEDAAADSDDELKEIRDDKDEPKFIVESIDEEKVGKGLVKSITGKVKGSLKRIFKSPESDEFGLSEDRSDEEDKLHSIEPLSLVPVDVADEDNDIEDESDLMTVNVEIGTLPSSDEIVDEPVDVLEVESIDHTFEISGYNYENTIRDDEDSDVEEPDESPEDDEQKLNRIKTGPHEEKDTLTMYIEVVPRRTVFREKVADVKEDDADADSDDELKDIRDDKDEPKFIVESIDEEKVGKGLVKSITGKVKGSLKRIFKSTESDEFRLSEDRSDEEDKLHSIEPLSLVPVDVADEDNDIEDESDLMPVSVKIGTFPSSDAIVDEPVDAIEVESIDHTFEIADDDDDDDDDNDDKDTFRVVEDRFMVKPYESPEEKELEKDSIGKEVVDGEVTISLQTEVVPRRTVFREKVPDVKEEDAADSDDELKDIRDDKDEPKFIVESIDEEKVGKGIVKSISGKVKGSLKRIFKRTESDEFGLAEERSDEEDKLHSIQPLSLVPVDVADEDNDIEGESDLMTVNVKIGTLPSSDEIVDEPVDVIEVESIDHTFEISGYNYENTIRDDEDSDVEEPDESPEDDEQKLNRIKTGPHEEKDTLTMYIEVVPRRTVFREKVPDVEGEEDTADSDDELKDIRDDKDEPKFIVESIDEEKVGTGFVRKISGKVKGSLKRFFKSTESDEFGLSVDRSDEEDKLHSIQPLSLVPVDVADEDSDIEDDSMTVNVKIGTLPSSDEIVDEPVDVIEVESIDHTFEIDDDDDEDEDTLRVVEDRYKVKPYESPKEDELEKDSIGKELDEGEVTISLQTEVVPRRTVFREKVPDVKEDDAAADSDDELKDIRDDKDDPKFIVESIDEEKVGTGFVRKISGKVKGSLKRFFQSTESDEFKLSEDRSDEEDKLHSIQPLNLVPVDVADEDNDIEDESDLMTVNVKIGTLPSSDEIVDEPVDVIEVESIDHTFEIADDDDDEGDDSLKDDEEREEDVKDVEEPDESPEEEEFQKDSIGKEVDEGEVTISLQTEVVPRRTVFREKVPDVKEEEDTADSDDELKDIRDDKDEPKFIVESIDEEKVGTGFVRKISGKVKGSLKRIFKSTESDEFGLSEDKSDEEDKLHSIQPLSLVPVDVADEDSDIEDDSDLMTVNVKIGTLPSSDEPVDAIEVESIDHTFEIADDDDEGDDLRVVEDRYKVKPYESPEEDELEKDSIGKELDEGEVTISLQTEVVPRRTVFREKVPDVKEDDAAADSDDELKDIRDDKDEPKFIVESIDEEKVGTGFVRKISGKVKGSLKRFFQSPESDEFGLSEDRSDEEDKLHSIQPLSLVPVDVADEDNDIEDDSDLMTVNVNIGTLPSSDEIVDEPVDVIEVESIDHTFEIDDDDDEDTLRVVEDRYKVKPYESPEGDELEKDSIGKELDEGEVTISLQTEVVPRRTVFREKVPDVKEDIAADSDDELKDIRDDKDEPKFIVESIDDEKVGTGFVRKISGKVKGSLKRFFKSTESDEFKLSEDRSDEEDKPHSIQPLSLVPVDVADEDSDIEDDSDLVTVNVKIGTFPSSDEIVDEPVDVIEVESIDHTFEIADDDDDDDDDDDEGDDSLKDDEEREEDVKDLEEPDESPEEDELEKDSIGKEVDEGQVTISLQTEVVPRRTVFREKIPDVKEEGDTADSDDELKDIRDDDDEPKFIVENIDEEKVGTGFVRKISGKVKGSLKRIFRRTESDEFGLSEDRSDEEDKLHSIQPLSLVPVDVADEDSDIEDDSMTVNVKIGTLPSSDEIVDEPVDVIEVESIDHTFEIADDDDDDEGDDSLKDDEEREEDVKDVEEPDESPEEDELEKDSIGKDVDEGEVTISLQTEVVPRRTVFREKIPDVKEEEDTADSDDELKDIRDDKDEPKFIVENIDEEKVGTGFVRKISGKVKGSLKRIFKSTESDEFGLSEDRSDEEDKLHSIQPLSLVPVDVADEDSDIEDDSDLMTVNVKIGTLPSSDEIVDEPVDVIEVESIDHTFEIADDDDEGDDSLKDDEEREEDVKDVEEPDESPEEDELEKDSIGKELDEGEVTISLQTEVVPRRTVFREKVPDVKEEEDTADSDDELKDIRDDKDEPKFIVENIDEEKVGTGFVRKISGKVKGSLKRIFRRTESDEFGLSEDRSDEEDKLHSIQPLSLVPVDVADEDSDIEDDSMTVNVKIGTLPSSDEIVDEPVDVIEVESIDHTFEIDDDDDEGDDSLKDDEEREEDVKDVEEPDEPPEEDELEKDSIGKELDEGEVTISLQTEVVPRRTVFREKVPDVKEEEDTADSDDELKDIRDDKDEPKFIVENIDEEKVGTGFVRKISGKVKGSLKRIFRRTESDEFGLSEDRSDEEDKLHSIQPLSLVPVDVADEDSDIEDDSMTVNVKIGTLPSSDEIVDEPVDVIEVESIDHTFEIDDDDDEGDDSLKDDEEREEDVKDVEEPDKSPEEDELEKDSIGKELDEGEVTISLQTEVVPRRTVFREKIPDVKEEEDTADSDDELKDIRDDDDEPKFIVENIDEEKVGTGFVRKISGKVKGSLKRIFKSTESDEFGLSEDRSDEEDKLHSIQPLSLVPVDVADEDSDIEDDSDLMIVNVKIGTLPSSDEIVDEPVDAIEVESIDHTFEIADDDDDDEGDDSLKDEEEREEDVKDVEEPDESPEEDELEKDRIGKELDEGGVTISLQTEIMPRRTVFGEEVPDVKEEDASDSGGDQMSDDLGESLDGFIVQDVEDERSGIILLKRLSDEGAVCFLDGHHASLDEDTYESNEEDEELHQLRPLELQPLYVSHDSDVGDDQPCDIDVNTIEDNDMMSEISLMPLICMSLNEISFDSDDESVSVKDSGMFFFLIFSVLFLFLF